jgi:murein DD-endopeptidase MepM/ murein hydrolase activator NlpD
MRVNFGKAFQVGVRAAFALAYLVLAFGAAALPVTHSVAQDAFELQLPIDCDITRVCSIQKHFDLDPGPQRMDHACGRLSVDGDTGTDFRLPDLVAMEGGVAVLAAAPGVVKATRDGMDDVSVRKIGREAIRGREAGNGVVINHGKGWETQYSHLKRGSVRVKRGDLVTAGHPLGLVGLSGNTEFPHVELIVRYHGRPVDPFVGTAETFACGDLRQPLWSAAALALLHYRPTGPLVAGFAAERPQPDDARQGLYAPDRLPSDPPALVFWADIWGAMAGDRQRIRIIGPDGRPMHEDEKPLLANNISWFAFSGVRRPATGWPTGMYTGTYELLRNGTNVVSITEQVAVRNR